MNSQDAIITRVTIFVERVCYTDSILEDQEMLAVLIVSCCGKFGFCPSDSTDFQGRHATQCKKSVFI